MKCIQGIMSSQLVAHLYAQTHKQGRWQTLFPEIWLGEGGEGSVVSRTRQKYIQSLRFFPSRLIPQNADPEPRGIMLDVITRRGDLELTLQIGAEILVSEDPRNRGDHPDKYFLCIPGAESIGLNICYSKVVRKTNRMVGQRDKITSHQFSILYQTLFLLNGQQ